MECSRTSTLSTMLRFALRVPGFWSGRAPATRSILDLHCARGGSAKFHRTGRHPQARVPGFWSGRTPATPLDSLIYIAPGGGRQSFTGREDIPEPGVATAGLRVRYFFVPHAMHAPRGAPRCICITRVSFQYTYLDNTFSEHSPRFHNTHHMYNMCVLSIRINKNTLSVYAARIPRIVE